MNREVSSMTPRVVVILGMHRSGTSVLSAGLEALGVEFGENLIPPRPDNPKGYWEDARLVAFNDRVLSLCGFSSGDVGLSSRRVLGVERFEEIVQQAMALLTELLAGKALLGIKDPRMPRLMPIWQAAFDALGLWVDYVIAARHPLSVAESLAARDHLSREKSLMLWYEHSCRSMQWALHKGGRGGRLRSIAGSAATGTGPYWPSTFLAGGRVGLRPLRR
ncbi:TPA: sulfotransferase family protein [Pseudomonas aeruginosa]